MTDSARVLAWARSQDYAPAQNVRNAPMGGLELLVLGDLDAVERVAWIGSPSPGDRAMVRAALPAAQLTEASNVVGLETGRYDAVVVSDGRVVRALGRDGATADALAASLAPDGTALVHAGSRSSRAIAAALGRADPGTPTAILRGFPLRGPLRALLPADDAGGYRILDRRGLLRASAGEAELRQVVTRGEPGGVAPARSTVRGRFLRRARSGVRAVIRLLATAERRAGAGGPFGRAVVVHGPDAGRLPGYLRRMAGSSGPGAWAVAAPGAFPSQKVLWALRAPGSDDIGVLAKMTRDPMFSPRLAHAHAALSVVAGLDGPVSAGVPRPVFAGQAGGLAIAAEAGVTARPMGAIPPLGARTPAVGRTVDWLLALAERTRRDASGADVADALEDLRTRLATAAPLPEAVASALDEGTATLRAIREPVPIVMQHGDPGVNNVLVGADGAITVLDWENGEPDGLPLWDLLYFVRSVAVTGGTGVGVGRLEASLVPFTEDGPLADLLRESVWAAADRIGLPAAAVEPLVHHCWVQQALKETTRLPAGAATGSIFLRFLADLVARRDAPVFRRLVGEGRT